MKKYIPLLFVLMSFILIPNAHAEGQDVWEMAKSDQYGTKAGGMIGRGLVNVATSFVDVIVHTVEGTKTGVPFVGTLTGLGSGIGCTALRLSSGALDVVTFWVPGFNGIPVSKSYSDCLDMGENTAAAPASEPVPAPRATAPRQDEYAAPTHNAMDYVKK